jgi:hypothetical protein
MQLRWSETGKDCTCSQKYSRKIDFDEEYFADLGWEWVVGGL